jgi:hypothetical protein
MVTPPTGICESTKACDTIILHLQKHGEKLQPYFMWAYKTLIGIIGSKSTSIICTSTNILHRSSLGSSLADIVIRPILENNAATYGYYLCAVLIFAQSAIFSDVPSVEL